MKKISPTRRAALLLGRSFDKLEEENKKLKRQLASISDAVIFVIGTSYNGRTTSSLNEELPVCAISMEDVIERVKISRMIVLSTSGNDDYIQVPRNGDHIAATFKIAK